MKAAIYRWRVPPANEKDFERRWHIITKDIMREHGGGGSRLHRAENGDYVAYARWPDKKSRDRAFSAYSAENPTPQREGRVELIEEVWLDIMDDLLIPEAELPEPFHNTPEKENG